MGFKLAGIMFILMLAMGSVGSWYYSDSQARIATLRENTAQLEVAVQTAEASLNMLREENVRLGNLNSDLSASLQEAEQYGDDLRAKLQKHELTRLATQKPVLIENRMQDATNKLWDDLVDLTDTDRVQSADAGDNSSNNN